MEGKGEEAQEMGTPLTCPNTVTIRRNPHRRARPTPTNTPLPFPHQQILSAQTSSHSSSSRSREESNINVFLRIRPLPISKASGKAASVNQRSRAKNVWPHNITLKNTSRRRKSVQKSSTVCIEVNDSHSVTLSTPTHLQHSKKIKSEVYGGFSHVFSPDSSQIAVYETMVKPMVDEFLSGKSGMLAALGPSGSGKSHTVFGCPRDPGMVPLALHHIFKETEASRRSFHISIFEIYSERGKAEKMFDLLRDGCEVTLHQSNVKGLQEVLISTAEQAESMIAQAVVKRATAVTNTNSQSSRSQCIINVYQKCEGTDITPSHSAVLTIIDLAGAEREKKTGNQGTRLLESNFINNTIMVLGLCLRSLLEHQRNPKKPLQKHFQNSLLTRFLRDYLEGKKRMTLLLTAKSGEEDYLDTSHLLRQASPFMKIKYDEIEPSNIVPNKRQYQASSTFGQAKRMRLTSNEESNAKELHISKGDAPRAYKSEANSRASKSEFNSQAQSDRSHLIMQNFAKALWNILKQCNAKLKDADMEIQSLKEIVGHEKEKYQELETEMNEFKAFCTCRQCSNGCDISNQESLDAQASPKPRLHQADNESTLGTSSTLLDAVKSDRKDGVCLSRPKYHNALEAEGESDIFTEFNDSLPLSIDERLSPSSLKDVSSTKAHEHAGYRPDDTTVSDQSDDKSILPNCQETFVAEPSSEPKHDHLLYDESIPGTSSTKLDTEISNREGSDNSSKSGKHLSLVVESKIQAEFSNSSHPSDETREPSSPKAVSSTKGCDQVDDRHSERKVNNSCNPQKPKRRLMPSTSVLLRDLSNLDLVDETTASKGRKGAQKSAANVVKRTDGSISLIRMLTNNHHL